MIDWPIFIWDPARPDGDRTAIAIFADGRIETVIEGRFTKRICKRIWRAGKRAQRISGTKRKSRGWRKHVRSKKAGGSHV